MQFTITVSDIHTPGNEHHSDRISSELPHEALIIEQ
jgi:hypothetical protein